MAKNQFADKMAKAASRKKICPVCNTEINPIKMVASFKDDTGKPAESAPKAICPSSYFGRSARIKDTIIFFVFCSSLGSSEKAFILLLKNDAPHTIG